MSLISKVLMAAATAFAGEQLRRFVGGLEVDNILQPIGLARRRSHSGESMLFLAAGIVVGGAATVALTSSSRKELIAWLSNVAKKSVDEVVDEVEAVVEDVKVRTKHNKEKVWGSGESANDKHVAAATDGII